MANYKTVPNQKVVRVSKEICNNEKKENYYARINLAAMDAAAINLDAGAFKLWVYFAKNQNGFEFALSSKAVQETFGMKIKQYNNAVNALIEGGYLVITKGNNYTFLEKPVITKEDNAVDTKSNNAVITKEDNQLLPKELRNTTHTTNNTTTNTTDGEFLEPNGSKSSRKEEEELMEITRSQLNNLYNPKEYVIENDIVYFKPGSLNYGRMFKLAEACRIGA